ncbi:DeoR/GlpR family DNA-binding transcription regulator [Alkalihalobacillus sp. LMS39]|uniref:DeoR/GlpR family DNA-binding transcription regulator n=1 Tax=Alkalihalobacillus sp. LMS39 TaxID=2924032 RepID=UPI001FB224FF|nr:DeoR/GlpR family DNA-binding transcription regulator [Alkalihalobacillus sp. LMS39]UOE93585.1 DeoR/GlpR family DNA-binding transcription regulator [Alkalihalobacillus sp. LMS39]
MLGPNRRKQIVQLLRERKQIIVKEIAVELASSEGTIRNDLKVLEKEGFLVRTHGGAVLPPQYEEAFSFQSRTEEQLEEKQQIAKMAFTLLKEANCIIIDASSTGYELAKLLLHARHVTVITNGLATAQLLASNPNINVIVIGGMVRPNSIEVEGLLGKAILAQVHADLLFISAHGISLDHGVTDFSIQEAELKKMMVQNADKVVVLMDHTKHGRKSLATSIQLDEIDVIVTTSKIDPMFKMQLEQKGIQMITN